MGEPLSVGRKTRTVPTAIKRALEARDRGCVFPGCHHKRFVDAHHIKHWSAGGETSLDNLLLLCTRHHRMVHEGGFAIAKDYLDRWYFKRPDGQAVPHWLATIRCFGSRFGFRGQIGSPSAEGFLSRLHKTTDAEGMPALPLIVAERSPPAYLM